MQARQQGELAENLARTWLESRHFQFIQRNFSRRVGELDLIMLHPDQHTIVFVEVRYRANQRYGGGIASVTPAKQRRLVRTANAWLQRFATSATHARIDVISISPATADTPTSRYRDGHDIVWIENAIEE